MQSLHGLLNDSFFQSEAVLVLWVTLSLYSATGLQYYGNM